MFVWNDMNWAPKQCVSNLPSLVWQKSLTNHFRKWRVCSGSWFKGIQSIVGGGLCQQEFNISGHMYQLSGSREMNTDWCLAHFLLFIYSRTQAHGVVVFTFKTGLPSSVNSILETMHRQTMSWVSMVILNPVNLTLIASKCHIWVIWRSKHLFGMSHFWLWLSLRPKFESRSNSYRVGLVISPCWALVSFSLQLEIDFPPYRLATVRPLWSLSEIIAVMWCER